MSSRMLLRGRYGAVYVQLMYQKGIGSVLGGGDVWVVYRECIDGEGDVGKVDQNGGYVYG